MSVNGTAITYSDIAPGLPTSYYNGEKTYSFVWNSLGQLHGGVVNNKAIMYEYNSDGLRTFRRGGSNSYNYYYDGDRLIAQKWGGNKYILFHYDESDSIYAITYCNGTTAEKYNLFKNLQGDVVEVRSKYNALLASYNYDPWGNIVSITDSSGNEITDATHIAHINPIRYRSYYYDDDTGFYYLKSRYYDPEIGRFISADSLVVNSPDAYGYNLFAYCGNNPVNYSDPNGDFPKWIEGLLNIVSGIVQMATATIIIATSGWTGAGGVAGGVLALNGAAEFTQGIGQIFNDVTKTNVFYEDNLMRTGAMHAGYMVGGDTGANVAGGLYDTLVFTANLYGPKLNLQKGGYIPVRVNINQIVNNPYDEFVTIGPAQGVISNYCSSIPQYGYGKISATELPNNLYQLTDGHHRIAALRNLGETYVNIYLTH